MNQRFDTILNPAPWSIRTARASATSASATGGSPRSASSVAASAGRGDRLQGPAHPARRDRHPGAFPRAGADAQGRPRDRLARRRDGRRHRRVRDAEHQPADRSPRRRSPTRSAPGATACIAISPSSSAAPRENVSDLPSWSGCRAAPASRCSWAPRPARCWSRTTRACAAIFQGDPPPRRLSCRGRVPPERAQAACASRATRVRTRCGATSRRR